MAEERWSVAVAVAQIHASAFQVNAGLACLARSVQWEVKSVIEWHRHPAPGLDHGQTYPYGVAPKPTREAHATQAPRHTIVTRERIV